jgi:2-polyprenyl-3-methyl-5-hydroxy-6-metoxy-1,4-benzoquinol methylase
MLAVQARIALGMLSRGRFPDVLDVGGGHGQLAEPLCRAGYRVTVLGSDPSCRKRIAALADAGRCEFRVGNVIHLPFPDRSFDAVVCFRLLTHCERWPQLVGELCRVAKVAVIVDYPAHHGIHRLASRFFEAKKRIEGNTRTWRSFRDAEVQSEFRRRGYALRRRRAQFFLPMVFHRRWQKRGLSTLLEGICRMAGLTRLWGSPVIVQMVRSGGPFVAQNLR